jgi:hypothetical protein
VHVVAARLYHSIAHHDDAMMEFDKALAIKPAAYNYMNRLDSRPKSDRIGRMADLTAASNLKPRSPYFLMRKSAMLDAQVEHPVLGQGNSGAGVGIHARGH